MDDVVDDEDEDDDNASEGDFSKKKKREREEGLGERELGCEVGPPDTDTHTRFFQPSEPGLWLWLPCKPCSMKLSV